MTWQAINDSELVSGSPLKSSIAFRLRDNTTAVANGDAGAPRIQNAALDTNSVTNVKVANGTLGAEKLQTGTDEINWVMARIAGASAGVVGDRIMASYSGGSNVEFGETRAASEVNPSNSNGNLSPAVSLSGVWMCLGYADNTGGATGPEKTTIWKRVS